MSNHRQTLLASRPAALVLALSLVAGLSAPFLVLPPVHAAYVIPDGTTELSATPVNQTKAVPPNLAVTFDDSGSMQSSRVNDQPPWTTSNSGSLLTGVSDWGNGANNTSQTSSGGGPWRCAGVIDPTATSGILTHVMNGVYYNPNIVYVPPVNANGTSFPNADATLTGVWVDGISVNRPLSPAAANATAGYNNNPDLDQPSTGALTNLLGTTTFTTTVTYYVSFGACAANADAGSCVSNSAALITSGGNKNKYYYSYKNSTGSSGSGTNTVYYGTSLQTGTTTGGSWKQVVGTTATKNYNTWTVTTTSMGSTDNRWICGSGPAVGGGGGDLWNAPSPMDGQSHTLSDGTTVAYPNGGPYYYRLKQGVTIAVDSSTGNPTYTGAKCPTGTPDCDGLRTLYDANNWEAVPVTNTSITISGVTVNQYQNFANWYAYYRTRNQMARSSLSRVFGSSSLAAKTADGGYGGDIRVAWQNLNSGTYQLPSSSIISALIDTSACTATASASASPSGIQRSGATTTPPDCYRSAFFNWIFQVGASGGTPTRSAMNRAGTFFTRGNGNTGATGNLEDPYWQPPQNGAFNASSNPGNELYCRQNFHMLVTDGLWNGGADGPKYSTLTLPASALTLPDGVTFPDPTTAGVASIYNPVHDGGDTGYASLSDIAFHYWATDLRPDLYGPAKTPSILGNIVAPYLPDTKSGLFSGAGNVSGGYGNAKNIPSEEYFNPNNDPATWPHMSEYLVGLGVQGQLNFSTNTDCTDTTTGSLQDACNLRKGAINSSGSIGWPPTDGTGGGIAGNVDDTWHAALAGRGSFFSAGNPQQLVDQLSSVLTSISARAATAATGAVNASVATTGALSFSTGYSSLDWSGILQAVTLNSDGTLGSALWDAGSVLDATSASSRNIYTDAYSGGSLSAFTFVTANAGSLDATENSASVGLQSPALGSSPDTVANRINYLRGDQTHEADGTYRKRTHLLGAIINSQPLYVAYPSSNYYDYWPAGSPEAATGAQTYSAFVTAHAQRAGTVYVGANDGMLHAFNAPVPQCTSYDVSTGLCSAYNTGSNPGQEQWAFIPRAVYANLGNLTNVSNFQFRPTVDATPVTRDVFFSDKNWHTILTGGVGVGGRGVYALDITGAANASTPATAPDKVLWEFDADMPATSTCVSNSGTCLGTDLGYTVSQPNISRLNNGEWVVLVSNGYFPDCSKPDIPTATIAACQAIAAQAPKDASGNPYSALFVFDAQTGKMVAELKTPTGLTVNGVKVTSFGLATPVMGDYNADQIDDVAFAGDLQGNLWRFDLSDSSPANWKVTLAYQGIADANGNQGLQPITTMPRLFPDPATGSFMVVFGTGKYLGAGDNSSNAVQAIYGIRDTGACATAGGCAVAQSQLVQQTLAEQTVNPPNPYQGATVRTDTDNPVPVTNAGWYIPLKIMSSDGSTQVNSGERVVVTPGAIFSSNMVIVQTLIAGAAGSDPCNPSTQGALMVFNTNNGGPGTGVSSLGGAPIVGGRISNARTSGSLPVVSALGGGQFYVPGTSLSGSSNTSPFAGDQPIWRRRSWSEINQIQ